MFSIQTNLKAWDLVNNFYVNMPVSLWYVNRKRIVRKPNFVKFDFSLSIGKKSAEQGLDMSRLPVFSLQEKGYIKGTSDFLGLGHFTTRYITERNYPSRQGPSYQNDRDLVELVDPNWPDLGSKWLYSVPWGFRRLLHFAQVITTLSYLMIFFSLKTI